MAKRVQILRHNTTEANEFTGLMGEVTHVMDTGELRTHDGITLGGNRILTVDQNDLRYQAADADLLSLANFSATAGIVARTGVATFTQRTLDVSGDGLTITNPAGQGGNPTFALGAELQAFAVLDATAGLLAKTGANTYARRTLTGTAGRITVTNGDGSGGNPTIDLASGIVSAGTYASVTVDTYGRVTAGTALDATLTALAAYNTNGIICQTAADTFAGRTLTGPAAGITVTNGNGVSGNPTLALANDLAALEALASTGIAVRTGSDAWTQRSIAASTGLTVTNGSGASGNPTVALDINALTEKTFPTAVNDFILLYDAAGSAHKKVRADLLQGARGALVDLSGNHAASNNIQTSINWTQEIRDTDGIHQNVTNNTFLIVPDGVSLVRISCSIMWATNATGFRFAKLQKNLGDFPGMAQDIVDAAFDNSGRIHLVSAIIPVTAGDTFSVAIHQDSGGVLNVLDHDNTWFQMEILG
jgi:hypothetical protein